MANLKTWPERDVNRTPALTMTKDEFAMDYDLIAPDGTPVVYFNGGPIKVKIGYTASLKMRVSELWMRVGCPLELYAVAYGGRDLEREYHKRFADLRLHGEWFETWTGACCRNRPSRRFNALRA